MINEREKRKGETEMREKQNNASQTWTVYFIEAWAHFIVLVYSKIGKCTLETTEDTSYATLFKSLPYFVLYPRPQQTFTTQMTS
jgi:hypothetical protein